MPSPPPPTRTAPHRPRRLLAAAAAVASGALLAACGTSASATSTRAAVSVPTRVPPGVTLRVADQLDTLTLLLSASGEDHDFPYKVTYSQFVGGPPMLQAFQAGSVDVGYVADTPLIFAQAAHQPITAFAGWAPARGTDALVSAPGADITGWASLKGRKVAYQQGTVEEAVVLEGLHSVGLSLKDITPVNLPTTSITSALESRSVSAAILVQPLIAAYLAKEPSAHQVVTDQDITARVAFLIGQTSDLTDPGKVAAIADFVSRLKKAYQWVDAHPAQWAEDLYVKEYKVPLALGEHILSQSGPTTFLSLPGDLVGSQQTLADLYQAAGEIPARVDVSAEFNPTFNRVR